MYNLFLEIQFKMYIIVIFKHVLMVYYWQRDTGRELNWYM